MILEPSTSGSVDGRLNQYAIYKSLLCHGESLPHTAAYYKTPARFKQQTPMILSISTKKQEFFVQNIELRYITLEEFTKTNPRLKVDTLPY